MRQTRQFLRADPVSTDAAHPGEEAIGLIKARLGKKFVPPRQNVGPKVSQELFSDGVKATILAIVLISIYVAVRFEWQYGVGAFIATGHDVFVTAGLYSFSHMEFLVELRGGPSPARRLFNQRHRRGVRQIRENRRKYKRMGLRTDQPVDQSDATRTTLVSAATALTMVPLLFFGGPELFGFSAAILFGILVGTFSSTYVAAALLLYLPPLAGGAREETAAARLRSERVQSTAAACR